MSGLGVFRADTSVTLVVMESAHGAPIVTGGKHEAFGRVVGVNPDEGIDVDTVMQNADAAMYHAKASGRNNDQFFRPT